jgi:nucleotide-binding universal stress UspA family protein
MFDKIVVAIDGSDFSRAALTAAAGLAVQAGSAVEVVHVEGSPVSHGFPDVLAERTGRVSRSE